MKKIITLTLVALVSTLVLVGCDQNKSATSGAETGASTNAAGTNAPTK